MSPARTTELLPLPEFPMTIWTRDRSRRSSSSPTSRSRPKNSQASSGSNACRLRNGLWVAQYTDGTAGAPSPCSASINRANRERVVGGDALMLAEERRQVVKDCAVPQHRNHLESARVARVQLEADAHLSVDPVLDAQAADVDDQRRRLLERLLERLHPSIAGLEVVFVEPDVDTVAPQQHSKCLRVRRVSAGVAEKHPRVCRCRKRCGICRRCVWGHEYPYCSYTSEMGRVCGRLSAGRGDADDRHEALETLRPAESPTGRIAIIQPLATGTKPLARRPTRSRVIRRGVGCVAGGTACDEPASNVCTTSSSRATTRRRRPARAISRSQGLPSVTWDRDSNARS